MRKKGVIGIVVAVATMLVLGSLYIGKSYFLKGQTVYKGVGAVCSRSSHKLTVDKMLEDYDAMWINIEENYAFMGVAERVTRCDFQKVKEDYREKVKDCTSDKMFYQCIEECLQMFGGCGHMCAIPKDGWCDYKTYMTVYKNYESADIKILYKRINNPVSKTFYEYEESAIQNKEQDKNILEQYKTGIETAEYKEISTAYIKIPNFTPEKEEQIIQEIKDYFSSIGEYKNCIIDIRGNGGGSDFIWINGIVKPNLKQKMEQHTIGLIQGKGSKDYVSSVIRVKNISKLDTSGLTELRKADLEHCNYFVDSTDCYEPEGEPLFKGKFYVLTDGANYSASADFVRFCKNSGFATLVGSCTGGDGGSPMLFVLPNSGIVYRFSSIYILNPDGSSNEECGTKPDIYVKQPEYALDRCFEYIKNNKE